MADHPTLTAIGQVLTLRQVLDQLRGLVGKTKLLQHLAEHPEHQGGPTHRRWGNRIVFYPEDLPRLRGSLECPLKIVRRPGSAMLYVRGTVRGQSVFESTETADPERAEGYRIKRENELWDRATYGERAVVTFARAVESYLAAKEHTPTTKTHVKRLLLHFGTTPQPGGG